MLRKSLLSQRLGDFTASIRAKVETQHHVTLTNFSVYAINAKRLNEFICDACLVIRADSVNRRIIPSFNILQQNSVFLPPAPIACRIQHSSAHARSRFELAFLPNELRGLPNRRHPSWERCLVHR